MKGHRFRGPHALHIARVNLTQKTMVQACASTMWGRSSPFPSSQILAPVAQLCMRDSARRHLAARSFRGPMCHLRPCVLNASHPPPRVSLALKAKLQQPHVTEKKPDTHQKQEISHDTCIDILQMLSRTAAFVPFGLLHRARTIRRWRLQKLDAPDAPADPLRATMPEMRRTCSSPACEHCFCSFVDNKQNALEEVFKGHREACLVQLTRTQSMSCRGCSILAWSICCSSVARLQGCRCGKAKSY